jgi:hypothetical protein
MPSRPETDPHTPEEYIHHGRMEGLKMANTFFASIHTTTHAHATTTPTL